MKDYLMSIHSHKLLLVAAFMTLVIDTSANTFDLSGTWHMNANNHPAILEIAHKSNTGSYEYINWWDCATGQMENLVISGNIISWDRECDDSTKNQHYTGKIADSHCEIIDGVFTFKGKNYKWSASKDVCIDLVGNFGHQLCDAPTN